MPCQRTVNRCAEHRNDVNSADLMVDTFTALGAKALPLIHQQWPVVPPSVITPAINPAHFNANDARNSHHDASECTSPAASLEKLGLVSSKNR